MTARAGQIPRNPTRILGSRALLLPGLLLGLALLALCLLWSINLGAASIDTQVIVEALTRFDETRFDHLLVQTVRLPRVLSGALVGAALAAAGALMQGLTRNPLADAGILGINAGAAFAVVLAISALGVSSLSAYAAFALAGAAVAALLVYGLGALGPGGATPLRLTLAGVVLTALLSSLSTAILIQDEQTLDQIRFWTAGSLAGRDMALLGQTAPYMLAGMAGALLISRQITTMSLGEDVARGLGQNTVVVRLAAALLIVLLAGGAVALAGPIGFVGLVAPHVARAIAGTDYRWTIPYAMLIGALVVTVADVAARVMLRPQELPVGVMMALVGAPFMIYFVRKARR